MHWNLVRKQLSTAMASTTFEAASLVALILGVPSEKSVLWRIAVIDDFEFAMNSINWIIDTQITEKRAVYFVRLRGLVGKMVPSCFDVNRKKTRWPEIRLTFYLLSTQERNMYEGQDYKHDFYLGKLLLSRGSPRQPHVWMQFTTATQEI